MGCSLRRIVGRASVTWLVTGRMMLHCFLITTIYPDERITAISLLLKLVPREPGVYEGLSFENFNYMFTMPAVNETTTSLIRRCEEIDSNGWSSMAHAYRNQHPAIFDQYIQLVRKPTSGERSVEIMGNGEARITLSSHIVG
ncbi:hypothetical protein Tcan_14514 [Toxocara canis]|uniref:Uncharacterized protein n=1 Tax=Toxocara canis TaxID=6265 RepID=A0A0B2V8A9_TOXCA|nr:hypothetical protein Tcan_14514 [Toxocara canis]